MTHAAKPELQTSLERRPGSARARSRAESRRRLLEAGRRLFVKHGVASVNSNEIARAAEVATGTFYLHFANKHELFGAIVRDLLADLRAAGDPRVAQSDGRLETVLGVRAEVLLDFCEQHQDMIRLIFGPDGVAAGVVGGLMDDVLTHLRSVVERRAGPGGSAPGLARELAIEAVAAAWMRTATWWCDHLESASREDTLKTLVSFTLTNKDLAYSERSASGE
jgi:AcrR family transcriptional regulator